MQSKVQERLFDLAVFGALACGVIALFVGLNNFKTSTLGVYLVAGALSFGLVAVALARRG